MSILDTIDGLISSLKNHFNTQPTPASLQPQLDTANATIKTLTAQRDAAQTLVTSLTASNTTEKQELDDAAAILATTQSNLAAATADHASLVAALSAAQDKATSLATQVATLTATVATEASDDEALQTKIATLQALVAQLTAGDTLPVITPPDPTPPILLPIPPVDTPPVVTTPPVVVTPPPVVIVPSAGSLDSAEYDFKTGAGMGGAIGALPVFFQAAPQFASDAEFRKSIVSYGVSPGSPNQATHFPEKAATGSRGTAPWSDGNNCDLITWQKDVAYLGTPTFEQLQVGDNLDSSEPNAQLMTGIAPITSIGIWERRMYQKGWTPYGDADNAKGGADFNKGTSGLPGGVSSVTGKAYTGQAAGWKRGPYTGWAYQDSKGFNKDANGVIQTIYGRAGLQSVQMDLDANVLFDDLELCDMSAVPGGNPYTNELFVDTYVSINQYVKGTTIMCDHDYFMRVAGSGLPFVRIGQRKTTTVGDVSARQMVPFTMVQFGCKNYNQSRRTPQRWYQWGGQAFNLATNPDPFFVVKDGL